MRLFAGKSAAAHPCACTRALAAWSGHQSRSLEPASRHTMGASMPYLRHRTSPVAHLYRRGRSDRDRFLYAVWAGAGRFKGPSTVAV